MVKGSEIRFDSYDIEMDFVVSYFFEREREKKSFHTCHPYVPFHRVPAS